MRKMQILCSIFLILLLSTEGLCAPALAAGTQDYTETITYFADGSYLVTRITCDSAYTSRSVEHKSGKKHYDFYNSNRKLSWTFRVHGAFTYDGSSAEATSADYSYDIYDSAWSFNGGSASYSGATATATGSFTLLIIPNSVTLSLTCSPKGVLS